MTTKVKIELVQEHLPVVVEILDETGRIRYAAWLLALGAWHTEYVHSGQTLRIREMTTAEIHTNGSNEYSDVVIHSGGEKKP